MNLPCRSYTILVLLASAAPGGQQPPGPQAIFEKAKRALIAGDYAQAERGFREVLKLDPGSAAAYIDLGVAYMRQQRWDPAVAAFNQAKKLAPEVLGIDLNLGLVYYHKSEFPQAIPAFERVLVAHAADAQARYLLGMSYFMLNDYSLAARAL